MTEGVANREDVAEESVWPTEPLPATRRRANPFVVFLRRSGKVMLSLASVAVLAVTWYGWWYVGDPNDGLTTTQVFDDDKVHAVPLDGAVDILLVGMDSRTDAQGNPLPREVLDALHAGKSDGVRNTDTMILVHIPQNGRRAVAISFPRDSWVQLAGGYGKHKLNSAFAYAYNDTAERLRKKGETDTKEIEREATKAGRRNLIATLENFIGKPGMTDRYAEVNLASFYEITRALGGVEVCLKHAVKEEKSGIDLPAGRQTIEGVQALAFVRQRYRLPHFDLDRIARQQAFLSGLARKVLSRDVLMNPRKLGNVIAAVKKSVVLSDNWDLTEFAAQMRGLNSGNVEFHTIPVVGNAVVGGADVLKVDPQQVHDFVEQLTSDSPPQHPSTSAAPTTTSKVAPSSNPGNSVKGSNSPTPPSTTETSDTQAVITGGEVPCVD